MLEASRSWSTDTHGQQRKVGKSWKEDSQTKISVVPLKNTGCHPDLVTTYQFNSFCYNGVLGLVIRAVEAVQTINSTVKFVSFRWCAE